MDPSSEAGAQHRAWGTASPQAPPCVPDLIRDPWVSPLARGLRLTHVDSSSEAGAQLRARVMRRTRQAHLRATALSMFGRNTATRRGRWCEASPARLCPSGLGLVDEVTRGNREGGCSMRLVAFRLPQPSSIGRALPAECGRGSWRSVRETPNGRSGIYGGRSRPGN